MKCTAVSYVITTLDIVKICEVHCSFLGNYKSWYSWNMWSMLQFCRNSQFLVQLKYAKYTAVLWGFKILGVVEICEVICSFVGIYNSWCSWNIWSTLQFCGDLEFLIQLKYAKDIEILWLFTIFALVEICEGHCSFVGIYNSWYSWNMWSTLQFCRDLQFLGQLKYAKVTAVLFGFPIVGTVKIWEGHCSFVGIYNSSYSWNIRSTL